MAHPRSIAQPCGQTRSVLPPCRPEANPRSGLKRVDRNCLLARIAIVSPPVVPIRTHESRHLPLGQHDPVILSRTVTMERSLILAEPVFMSDDLRSAAQKLRAMPPQLPSR